MQTFEPQSLMFMMSGSMLMVDGLGWRHASSMGSEHGPLGCDGIGLGCKDEAPGSNDDGV